MAGKLSHVVRAHLEKSRVSAISAVEVYNRPGVHFRSGQFIVLIIISWTALLHAIFHKRRVKPWYQSKGSTKGRGIRYVQVDGEPKYWELKTCLAEFFGSGNPAERSNLDLLIGLRNKIEHRHLPELDPALYGYCQSALLNLEQMIANEFGAEHTLNESLAVALQFSRARPAEALAAHKAMASSQSRSVREYIRKFLGDLPPNVRASEGFSFEVCLVPKIANRKNQADLSVEFVHYDPTQPEQVHAIESAFALVREKQVPVANLDRLKVSQVVDAVKRRIPHPFTTNTHVRCWKHFQVRPSSASDSPEKTQSQYCVYDQLHLDYSYTRAWVEKLAAELAEPVSYAIITGRAPRGTNSPATVASPSPKVAR